MPLLSKMSEPTTKTTTSTSNTNIETNNNEITYKMKIQNAHHIVMKTWKTEGADAAAIRMFVHPIDGSQMSYAEMRGFYG